MDPASPHRGGDDLPNRRRRHGLRPLRSIPVAAVTAALLVAPTACGNESPAPDRGNGTAGSGAETRGDGAASARPGSARLGLRRVAAIDDAVEVRAAPGFPRLLFVVSQTGQVRVLRRGRLLRRPFLDISDHVSYGGERGLVSIGFPPDYRRSKRLYVYYTARSGDITIDEYRRASPVRAAPGSRRRVISIRHREATNHNGGALEFHGRLLFFGTGDGGGEGDPDGNAQNLDVLLGKLIRIDPRRRHGRPYTVPGSNPFVGRPGRDEIYAYGLRNPFRFSIQRRGGRKPRLAIGDVGQNEFEEVDYLNLAAARGANFGWNHYEGFSRFEGPYPGGTRKPVFVYRHGPGCSITGGLVVGGRGPKPLRGRYLFSDFCDGALRTIPARRGRIRRSRPTGLELDSPTSFAADSRGRLYVTSLSRGLFRITGR